MNLDAVPLIAVLNTPSGFHLKIGLSGGAFVMPMIRVFGMIVIVISWIMILVGFFNGSDLKKQGYTALFFGCIIFLGSYLSSYLR